MRAYILIASILLTAFNLGSAYKNPRPKIRLPNYGIVQGEQRDSKFKQEKFITFQGLQYGKIDTAYAPPEPYTSTQNVFTNEEQISCGKVSYESQLKSCLTLTVSTKNRKGNFPVMIEIAGHDLFESSISNSGPEYFMEKDVVLVSVQYRTGSYGFLSTGTESIPGNVGILDVIEALKWVQKYISHFGGNPNEVTLFGQHGSAAIIHVLTITPLLAEESLFHRVIFESGTALTNGMVMKDSANLVKYLSEQLECEEETDIDECLTEAGIEKVNDLYKTFHEENPNFGFFDVGENNQVLPESIMNLMSNTSKHYPMMGGFVLHPAMGLPALEIDHYSNMDAIEFLKNYVNDGDVHNMIEVVDPTMLSVMKQSMYNALWPGKVDIMGLDIKYTTAYVVSENVEHVPKSYFYTFNYFSEYKNIYTDQSYVNENFIPLTQENAFLFYNEDVTLNKKDEEVVKIMLDIWTSFAITGIPSSNKIYFWPPMKEGELGPYMKIDYIPVPKWNIVEQFFPTVLSKIHDILT